MNPNYKEWNWHGEYILSETPPSHKRVRNISSVDINDNPSEMVEDAFDNDFVDNPDDFAKILEDVEKLCFF